MNCPTARQCACGMRPDSESRSGVADGVVDQSGRPIRPVDAETGSAALPQSGLGLLSGKHPSGRASRGSCMGCGTADGSFPPPATTGPSGEAMMLMSDSTSSLAQGRRVVRCFFDLGVMVSAGVDLGAMVSAGVYPVHHTMLSADLVLMLRAQEELAGAWVRHPSWPQRRLT